MLEHVQVRYADLIDNANSVFTDTIKSLLPDARNLYLRLLNRKPEYYAIDKICYPEIKNISQAFSQLLKAGFAIQQFSLMDRGLYQDLTKTDLVDILAKNGIDTSGICTKKKSQIFRMIQSRPMTSPINTCQNYIKIMQKSEYELIKCLYFGRKNDLSFLVKRDLGREVKRTFVESFNRVQYNSFEEARCEVFYEQKHLQFGLIEQSEEFECFYGEMKLWPKAINNRSRRIFASITYELAKAFEKLGETRIALEIYQEIGEYPATERVARLLYQFDRENAESYLLELIKSPSSDDELTFANDFYYRKYKKKKRGIYSDLLDLAEVIELDENYIGMPEAGACKFYQNKGYDAFKTENYLWLHLFCLVFWDLLFSPDSGSVLNPFQTFPRDLRDNCFYDRHTEKIELILNSFTDSVVFLKFLSRQTAKYWGKRQGLFRWNQKQLEICQRLIRASDSASIAAILRIMSQDFEAYRVGFPDLTLFSTTGLISFREIKTASDSIRRVQLRNHKMMKSYGFDVAIAKVAWKEDPKQSYVVVDLETTGGRAETSRITEIGAIKYINGKVISEFHTLVNPCCNIPSRIQSLTGITDEMVASAPLFSEVASDFFDYLSGSIFVAHNVKFDYSFVREEFKRCGIGIRMPRMCTCSGMRKSFPKLMSYSLKNLSRHFNISLENHHRALDDAKAAGSLLALIKNWQEPYPSD